VAFSYLTSKSETIFSIAASNSATGFPALLYNMAKLIMIELQDLLLFASYSIFFFVARLGDLA
jgi:hypothetical protein